MPRGGVGLDTEERAWLRYALRLRRWMEAVLLEGSAAPIPPAPEDVWQVVLTTEGCAAALNGALAPAEREAAGELLHGFAVQEALQWEVLRRRLSALDARLASAALQAVVLKGARHVHLDGFPIVWVSDVDLLVRAGREGEAARALRTGSGSPGADLHTEPLKDRSGRQLSFDPWERAAIWPGFGALLLLPLAEHVCIVLHHAAERHPHRLGTLRELLVLRALRERLDTEGRALVVSELRKSGTPLGRWLWDLAGSPDPLPAARETFGASAAVRYLANRDLVQGRERPVPATRAAELAALRILPDALAPPAVGWRHRFLPTTPVKSRVGLLAEALLGPAAPVLRVGVRAIRQAANAPAIWRLARRYQAAAEAMSGLTEEQLTGGPGRLAEPGAAP